MNNKIVVSGMRPTGRLHLGNYWGALVNYIKIQNEYKCYFFIADLHALTTMGDKLTSSIKENTFLAVVDWLSAGVDPEKAVIFRQSDVSEHAELHLILSMITPLSWLLRNPTFKEQLLELYTRKYKGQEDKMKDAQGNIQKITEINSYSEEESKAFNSEYANYGFLGYPVLQTADILLYDADLIPIGKDQLPHIELTREIARRFNHILKKNIFKEPQPLLSETPVLPGIDGKKMSKSYNNTIELGENGKELEKKIMRMYTDPKKIRANDKGNPYGCSVFALHKLYNENYKDIENKCLNGETGCVNCKKQLYSILNPEMEKIAEKRKYYIDNPQIIDKILEKGAEKAREVANEKLNAVYKEINLK